jgi:hypothetical protein
MATPTSGTISIGVINSVFGRGNNLNAYRGTVWYQPNSLVYGYFPSGAISLSDFYNKQPNDPATTGSATYLTPGTTSFTAPLYRNSLAIYVWGAGAGGGGYGNSPGSSYTDGTQFGGTGGTSVFYGPDTLVANGGVGGQTAGTPGVVAYGTGGVGGTASGGTTNTSGGNGTDGNAGCIGGASPNGGAATAYLSTQSAGYAGNFQGGGGGGMLYSLGGKFPAAAGGGGGGGYTTIVYSAGGLTAGVSYTLVVGAGGAGGPNNIAGGNGANGEIYIVWS